MQGLVRTFHWRRLLVLLLVIIPIALLWLPNFQSPSYILWQRLVLVGILQLSVYGLAELWPDMFDRWLPRWAVQVLAVGMIAPVAAAIAYELSSSHLPVQWYKDKSTLNGYGMLSFVAVFVSPWVAVVALYRQISGQVQRQRLQFELEKSRLEREAIDARARLLRAQVEPHFLFNTLANVRELVESRSPQASVVLNHLIAYLRAAVPRINEQYSTISQELELLCNYLHLMQMRMPDRLRFEVVSDPLLEQCVCPTLTLMSLVENAVKHGIDPSEEGGAICVKLIYQDGRCYASVSDTGVGLRQSSTHLGTGLVSLEERLLSFFSGDARLQMREEKPHGFCVELDFPALQRDLL